MKVALLSNVNVDFVSRILAKEIDCIPSVGYGNVWGQLLDHNSDLNQVNPDIIVFLIDIEQLLDGHTNINDVTSIINEWFAMLDSNLKKEKDYFISDTIFRSDVLTDNDSLFEYSVVKHWMDEMKKRVIDHPNVHLLRLNKEISRVGKNRFFSDKMWYMGKIPYTNEGCTIIAGVIKNTVSLLNKPAKKALLLDLDNTLWGGVLGELGVDGIDLSDDHIGAIYKKIQQQIKIIKDTGILLAIVSKNNIADVQEVWDKHPYMMLKKEDFASIKINWKDKVDNIQQIAKELNLGIDSFVFIDDMAPERDNIRMRLPDVTVPDFPEKIEEYPRFIADIYYKYFQKMRLSAEDLVKTKQYAENALREESAKGLSFEDFLRSLNLVVNKVELDDAKLDRIAQMHGKTNQFNLTTKRYSRQDIDRLIRDGYRVYAYNVKDKFGDYGLVAVMIVDCNHEEIDSFLMSCRVMGKLIENYVIDDVEKDLLALGHNKLKARYIKTSKNAPVEKLFDRLGYSIIHHSEEETEYLIDLKNRPQRECYVNGKTQEVIENGREDN